MYPRSPQQALFGASLGPCRGLCPAEGATEARMWRKQTPKARKAKTAS